MKEDNLNNLNANFIQQTLSHPLFLNSVPKSGTHLLRNIIRMFVPVNQQYHDMFIQIPILRQHLGAFDSARPQLSWGHLLFSDESAIALRNVNHIVLVRDPYTWVLARARFFLSDTFQGNLEHLRGGNVAIDEVLNMMIFGIHGKSPTLQEIYTHNAVSWLGTKATILKYEDLIRNLTNLDSEESGVFFSDLFSLAGLGDLPEDWRERIKIGADREQSGTARENLVGLTDEIPDVLPDIQKKMVNVAAPGLREVLGYQD
tara:strand:- start:537 stop:1313 length:777 start_codon:yes stop_codon:yes gene_type:complete